MAQGDRFRLLTWNGLMADELRTKRVGIMTFMAILSCSMVATQTNYFVMGQTHTHVIAVLAPITAAALLHGPLVATLIGFLAGAVEMIHATYLPLDLYERYFSSPLPSIVLFALMGLVMGLIFSSGSRRTFRDNRHKLLALTEGCLVGAVLFTLLFSITVNLINVRLSFDVPEELIFHFVNRQEIGSQILADAILMTLFTVLSWALFHNRTERKLRESFQGWLVIVLTSSYLLTAALAYSAVSGICIASAENDLNDRIVYLSDQLTGRERILSLTSKGLDLIEETVESIHLDYVKDLATDLPLPTGGLVAIAKDGIIFSSNIESYEGQDFMDTVNRGFIEEAKDQLYNRRIPTQWYMEYDSADGSVDPQLAFIRIARAGDYQIMVALPTSTVFTWRPWFMVAISLAFLLLYAAMYATVSLLLRELVVRRIDETNETLSLITKGDLEQRVNVDTPEEFARLSSGINDTVLSLKDAIAAEGARIEQDLLTAKAIQESALPRSFPPFPDIHSFDIYASMTAAREVGGDFYDFFLVDDHTLGFLIADVSGKGIPSALFMMAAKAELSSYIGSGMTLTEAMQTANWHLCQGNDTEMFVTVWAATLDYQTGILTYVNAGHNPPLLRHEGKWSWLESKGGPLMGAIDLARYHGSQISLKKGDQLLLYTDGVTEAFNAQLKQYGPERLERFCAAHPHLHSHALVEGINADLRAWAAGTAQSDDITMLALEYGVPPESSGSITVPATIDHLEEINELIHFELAQRLCPISTQNQIDVVMEELFVNICNYAYEDAGEHNLCQVEYLYRPDPDSITIQLTDWGKPFNPLEQEDPSTPASVMEAQIGGLGIFMVKRMTDDMSYLRDGDANVLAITKRW